MRFVSLFVLLFVLPQSHIIVLDDYADLLLMKSNRFTVNILAEMVV